ncbi:endonuclease domain-containing protein [Azospirillum isscasi]|uniref:Endonuclease domain-containing protein n=1 Tax=Azospirillum isscasi TaxID=3053926 RepID=A0ABU0WLG5_9PROT|nr:endonuclease domain-containing protein [Azospirillum isscasi]MDQ2105025.1 endonuclease domain-containing protein [Azospirillum isscasi]
MPRIKENTRDRARTMRHVPTDAERKLWSILRRPQIGGWYFRRQHPIPPYIADFACVEARLVVEADGGQHADSANDSARDEHLRQHGWQILRFWNNDVLSNPEGVACMIGEALGPLPDPLPPKAVEGE